MLVTSVFHPYVGRSPARINLSGSIVPLGSDKPEQRSLNLINTPGMVAMFMGNEAAYYFLYVVAQRC